LSQVASPQICKTFQIKHTCFLMRSLHPPI
jgi:hypothetical protein